jgi:3-oxoadipate enol-lactonase
MKTTVNRLTLNYEISGKPDGQVVMMSHSLSTCLDMWQPQLPALEDHCRVLRYDTRGHGGSDAPQGAYGLDELADDAIGLLDALDIERVLWVGISMGGMIGQAMALNHPERLQALVLCDTTARMPEQVQPVWQERIERARTQGMPALVEETLQRWFTPPYLAERPPQVEMIRKQILATPVNGFIGCSEAIRRLDYLERLAGIKLPTLVIVGENDPGTPVAESEAICKRIPGARLQVLPSAAHLCNIEQADAFNRALVGFLDDVAAVSSEK